MNLSDKLSYSPELHTEAKALESQLRATTLDAQAQGIAAKHEYARAEALKMELGQLKARVALVTGMADQVVKTESSPHGEVHLCEMVLKTLGPPPDRA